MNDCLFCKMAANAIQVERVFENEHVFVIRDINPQAPVHLLAIPKVHYAALHQVPEPEHPLYRHLYAAVREVVIREGIADKGYRLVVNSGSSAGQSVDHIHIHILSGRQFEWPPG